MVRNKLSEIVRNCVAGDSERLKLLEKLSGFSKSTLRSIAGGRYVPLERSENMIRDAVRRMQANQTKETSGGPEAA